MSSSIASHTAANARKRTPTHPDTSVGAATGDAAVDERMATAKAAENAQSAQGDMQGGDKDETTAGDVTVASTATPAGASSDENACRGADTSTGVLAAGKVTAVPLDAATATGIDPGSPAAELSDPTNGEKVPPTQKVPDVGEKNGNNNAVPASPAPSTPGLSVINDIDTDAAEWADSVLKGVGAQEDQPARAPGVDGNVGESGSGDGKKAAEGVANGNEVEAISSDEAGDAGAGAAGEGEKEIDVEAKEPPKKKAKLVH
ncbi:hypothetical protein M427DRAFT_33456 [Gonapodya prolifera JEL478]|uniref:Uncharacterized protein n=1 Tax=Gonapodya prolifera (strain JEL478) TaxID=1344416 RepID=A0A139AB27_GONPJ|nr:hypothetical protein M427DRAFT_33456 [Gonapodya prolifera JEL478]|eukprot:KXS14031.1 hypothetical protein M427DRAFT_33456 [Gonapodya prolifera JEL478]